MLSGLPEYLNLIPYGFSSDPSEVPAPLIDAPFPPITRGRTRLVKPVEFLATELSGLHRVSEAFTRSIPRNRNRRSRGNASKSAGIVEAISASRVRSNCLVFKLGRGWV
jgi:hypothetical protein